MNNTITANDLKVRGVSILASHAKKGMETVITVRGQEKYVVLPKDEYNRLREYELTAAIMEAEQDLKNGRYKKGSIEDHIKRITNA